MEYNRHMKTLENVTLRWLEPEEIYQLEATLLKFGWAALNKNTCRVLAAFDDNGKLIGWEAFQLYPYIGPAFVEPEWLSTGLYEELADEMHKFLSSVKCRGAIVVAESRFAEKVCEKHGMKKLEVPVYIKVDMGEGA